MRASQVLARRALPSAVSRSSMSATTNGRGRLMMPTSPNSTISSWFHATSRTCNLAILKELRATSGAPMMECKKALDASDNDMEKALDWLRREFHIAAEMGQWCCGKVTNAIFVQ